MTLLTTLKKLREMEQKATPERWCTNGYEIITEEEIDIDGEGNRIISIPYDGYDFELLVALRNAAPAMLAVLECFHDGDAALLRYLIDTLGGHYTQAPTVCDMIIPLQQKIVIDALLRLQRAASLVEEKDNGCCACHHRI